ncbi:MAG: type VI secretion system tip protein VgrG [Gammaproteobacteria bacterium]|nr:type VI secretion system tip protein VgrG [Gammaproteobacteria bacterium]
MPLQDTRKMVLETPLGKDELLLQQMTVREELGRPYEISIIALSEDHNHELNKLLGESITVHFETFGGNTRYFNGLVSRFAHLSSSSSFARYEIIARPWLWFLTRNSDCRIFQEKSIPDIIKEVFRDRGFSDFDDRLKATYRTWEYCVQYRETDFNFVSRLMEQEGIYYYFEHAKNTHTMVLSDSYSAHKTVTDYDEVPYFPHVQNQSRERDHVYDWHVAHQVQPGKYAIDEFDFKKPTSDLLVKKETARDHAMSGFEIFDYPGEYVEKGDGNHYVKVRNEELHAQYERAEGAGNARGLAAGALFSLTQYPRDDENKEYLVTAATHRLVSDDYEAGGKGAEDPYDIDFAVMDSKQPFRPERITPKPMVQGPQTAVVVGKSGEEIWCDEFGRVKVQFHWDRHGKADENSSCWVRVAQIWAGVKWGAMHVPRMGQEVIVDFLEGDPDQPIITGRVYNGDNMPPYALPANQTQSGIKSRSSKDGGTDNFNEIYFEDKKGEEEMYIHAEKDQNTVVENDQTELVQRNKMVRVDNDRTESIGRDRSLHVERDKKEKVDRDKTIDVGKDHSEGIRGNMSISVAKNLTETVALNYSENVGVAMELTVGAQMLHTVGGNLSESVGVSMDTSVGKDVSLDIGKNAKTEIGEDATTDIGKNSKENIGENRTVTVKKNSSLKAKKIELTADDQISLKTGSAELVMKKNGDITLKGKKLTIKGSGNVIIKGSNVKVN